MRRRTVYFEGIRGRTNCPGAAIRASIWGIPIEARSCLDLTAVSGVSGLLAREARHAESQLSEGRRRGLQYFVSRSGAGARATAAVVAWLSGARTIRSSCGGRRGIRARHAGGGRVLLGDRSLRLGDARRRNRRGNPGLSRFLTELENSMRAD